MRISNILIKMNDVANAIPLVSTATNLWHIFEKAVIIPRAEKDTFGDLKNEYLKNVNDIKKRHYALLAVPFVGTILTIYCLAKDLYERATNKYRDASYSSSSEENSTNSYHSLPNHGGFGYSQSDSEDTGFNSPTHLVPDKPTHLVEGNLASDKSKVPGAQTVIVVPSDIPTHILHVSDKEEGEGEGEGEGVYELLKQATPDSTGTESDTLIVSSDEDTVEAGKKPSPVASEDEESKEEQALPNIHTGYTVDFRKLEEAVKKAEAQMAVETADRVVADFKQRKEKLKSEGIKIMPGVKTCIGEKRTPPKGNVPFTNPILFGTQRLKALHELKNQVSRADLSGLNDLTTAAQGVEVTSE